MKLQPIKKYCPNCDTKIQRCSRYEWFLINELINALKDSEVNFLLEEQSPLNSGLGFSWHFDFFVWVWGKNSRGCYGEYIEINGPNHDKRHKKAYDLRGLEGSSIGYREVSNEECTKENAPKTATRILKKLIKKANS